MLLHQGVPIGDDLLLDTLDDPFMVLWKALFKASLISIKSVYSRDSGLDGKL